MAVYVHLKIPVFVPKITAGFNWVFFYLEDRNALAKYIYWIYWSDNYLVPNRSFNTASLPPVRPCRLFALAACSHLPHARPYYLHALATCTPLLAARACRLNALAAWTRPCRFSCLPPTLCMYKLKKRLGTGQEHWFIYIEGVFHLKKWRQAERNLKAFLGVCFSPTYAMKYVFWWRTFCLTAHFEIYQSAFHLYRTVVRN